MDLYRDIILDHYKHPRNFGALENPTVSQKASNATCGDTIQMDVQVVNENGKDIIKDIKFSGVGCAISQSSASILTELVKNKTLDEVKTMTPDTIMELLGTTLTPSRVKCATLPLEVLMKALVQY
jgi:nitrogen fixation protein NifU and related proteins